MTKYFSIIGLLLTTGFGARAQSKLAGGVFLSPFSSYAGKPLDFEAAARYSTGSLLGVALQYDLSSKWSLTSGVSYESAKVRFSPGGLYANAYVARKNNTTIPLLVNFRPVAKKVSPYLSAGMLFSTNADKGVSARALIAAGVSYQAGSRWLIAAQPAFTLGANGKTDRVLFPKNRQVNFQTQLLYRFGE